jgi:hypothetical protein
MGAPPTGISEADWSATPVGVRAGFLELLQHGQEQHEEIEQLRGQLIALATELASVPRQPPWPAHFIVKSVTCLVLFHHKRAWHGARNCWQQATPAPGSHSGDRSAKPSDGPGGGPAALRGAVCHRQAAAPR